MDLLEESKKGNKIAFIELTSKYNHIFYKISRLFFTNDKDIEEILEKVFSKTFIEIINVNTKQEFLTWFISNLISECNEKNETENITVRKNSLVEEQLSNLIEYLRLPALLYFYANLSTIEISKILKITEQETSNFISESMQKLTKNLQSEDLLNETPTYSSTSFEKDIKKVLQADVSFNKTLFNNVNNYIKNTVLIQNQYSNSHMYLLVLIILILTFIAIFTISQSILQNKNVSSSVDFKNTSEIEEEKFPKPVLKPNFEDKDKSETKNNNSTNNDNDNIININTKNKISLNNLVTNSVTSESSTPQNTINYNSTTTENKTTSTPIKLNTSNTTTSNNTSSAHPSFNEFELEVFIENYAVGIERISYTEETLESNTILLYIAEQYLASKSNKSSLKIDTKYATTAENIHKYLTDITNTDYTNIKKIPAYNNYISYSDSSKSYLYGKDHTILLRESYDCSNISILEEQAGVYTASANVTRLLDDIKTNYEITFTFKLNTNYTYEKFKILSLKANNISFTPDNTVHFVDIQTEEDEK